MINKKQWDIKLNILKREYIPTINPMQNDSDSNVFNITLLNGLNNYDLTGLTVQAVFLKKDGTKAYINGTVTNATEGVVEIHLTNQVLAVSGVVFCEIRVYGTESELLIAPTFAFKVNESIDLEGAVESSNEFTALTETMADYTYMKQQFAAVIANATVDSEVIAARQGEATLEANLTGIKSHLADIKNRRPRNYGYNIKNALENYKAKLADYSSSVVKVYCVGDSITRGEYASDEINKSWVGVLRGLLQERYGNAGEGFINVYEGSLPAGTNPRWYYGAGWILEGTAGFGYKYLKSNGSILPSTVNFYGDSVDLIYITASGGKADITIDDVPVGVIDCAGSARWDKVITYSGLTLGNHILKITPQTTANVFLQGIIAKKGTAGIQVHKIAYSGARSGNWTAPNTKAAWGLFPPDLAVIGFGVNDVTNTTVTAFKTNMTDLINYWKGVGADVLLILYFRPDDTWTKKWPEYVNALYELADENNVGLVDIYQAWFESYEIAQFNGLFGPGYNDYSGASGTNKAHPGDKGYKHIANVIEPHLIL